MRRQDDADAVLGDDRHEVLEKLATCKGIEARHRLVQHKQLRSLRNSEREGELGPLAAGQRAGLLARVKSEIGRFARSARSPSQFGFSYAPIRRCFVIDKPA